MKHTHLLLSRIGLIGLGTFLASMLVPPQFANASGITRGGFAGVMYRVVFRLKAGVSYRFTTRNLSAGADTVMHVLSYPAGQFIAGDDDDVIFDVSPPVVQRHSTVEIPVASSDREVYIVVRGKPGTPDGTADFRIVGSTDSGIVKDATTQIQFSAGFVQDAPSLAAGTHVTTVEETFGTLDTIVLIVGNNDPVTSLAFDDNDGIDEMSFLRLSSACSLNCRIIVGTPSPVTKVGKLGLSVPPGPTTLVWDETIESFGHDFDGDELSTELEGLVGTDPSKGDTDGDGIDDGCEVYGAVGRGWRSGMPGGGKDGNLLKFPKYGANPIGPDVFVEVDWVPACPASDSTCCTETSCQPGMVFADQKQPTKAVLLQAFNSMNGAANVHFDAGLPTVAGDTSVIFGDWGGANRLGDSSVDFSGSGATGYTVTVESPTIPFYDKDCFTGAVPARLGFFHHLVITDDPTRGRLPVTGTTLFESAACAMVHTNDGSFAHELGHNFNLRHGGFANAADGELNCKLNYGSIMSYPHQTRISAFAPGYSIGRFTGTAVNGFTMNEVTGLGVTNAGILGVFDVGGALDRGFRDAAFPSGIDWNMDGRISPGNVRAPANWAADSCSAPYLRANWRLIVRNQGVSPSIVSSAALPAMTVAEASAASPQIYGVGPSPSGSPPGRAQLFVGSGNASSCQQRSLSYCTIWSQRSGVDFATTGGIKPQSQLAVAGPIIAYRDGGNLMYIRRGKDDIGWVRPRYLATDVSGDPAAIEVNGRVKIYAVDSGGFLRRWEFDEATGAWPVSGMADFWEDGTYVQTAWGVGVAHGVIRPTAPGVFAVIPNRANVAAGNPAPLEFARHTSTSFTLTITVPAHGDAKLNFVVPQYTYTTIVKQDKWQRLSAPGVSAGFARPSLVYAPFDVSVPDDGRFYMTWVRGGTGFRSRTAFIMFTEGNDLSAGVTSRRLSWKANQQTIFADPDNQSRDFSFGVGLSRFGASVAGVATDFVGSNYFPAADGIVNADLHDFDDNVLVRHNLACSVHGDSCDSSP